MLSIFIHADLDARVRRIARIYDLTDAKAKELIVKPIKNAPAITTITVISVGVTSIVTICA